MDSRRRTRRGWRRWRRRAARSSGNWPRCRRPSGGCGRRRLPAGRPRAPPLDQAGAVTPWACCARRPQTPFYLFGDEHWQRAGRPNPRYCAHGTENYRGAALKTAAARRRGPGAEPLVGEASYPITLHDACRGRIITTALRGNAATALIRRRSATHPYEMVSWIRGFGGLMHVEARRIE